MAHSDKMAEEQMRREEEEEEEEGVALCLNLETLTSIRMQSETTTYRGEMVLWVNHCQSTLIKSLTG